MVVDVTLYTGINTTQKKSVDTKKEYQTLNSQLNDAGKLTEFNRDLRYQTVVSNALLSYPVSLIPEDTKKHKTIEIKLDAANPKEKAALDTISRIIAITKEKIVKKAASNEAPSKEEQKSEENLAIIDEDLRNHKEHIEKDHSDIKKLTEQIKNLCLRMKKQEKDMNNLCACSSKSCTIFLFITLMTLLTSMSLLTVDIGPTSV